MAARRVSQTQKMLRLLGEQLGRTFEQPALTVSPGSAISAGREGLDSELNDRLHALAALRDEWYG